MTKSTGTRRAARWIAASWLIVGTTTACGAGGPDPGQVPAAATVAGVTITADPRLRALLPPEIADAGTVRVASDVPYPPFEMFVREGSPELTGLDYDLGQALGAKLGVRFEFTPQKFDGIVPAIQAGKFDAAMSALTDTKARQQVVDFVDYSVSGSGILVRKGNPDRIATLDDLCGKAVAAQAATRQLELLTAHQQRCAAQGKAGIDIQSFPKDSDAQLALRANKVSAQLLTKPSAGWTAKSADGGATFEAVDDPAAPGGYGATPNGIAITKRLPGLTEAVKQALQALIDDGTLVTIFDKYGVGSIAVESATVNAGTS